MISNPRILEVRFVVGFQISDFKIGTIYFSLQSFKLKLAQFDDELSELWRFEFLV